MIDLKNHYGFTRTPFGKNLAPSMLHRYPAHSEAVARITWCAHERALGVITGEVGSGKTAAARAAVTALDQTRHTLIYLPDPTTGTRGIHHHIVTALGGRPAYGSAVLAAQAAALIAAEHGERGRLPLLVVDEAHLLGHAQLEAIRLLTNAEMDAASPLACLLIGQPTLRRRIKLGILAGEPVNAAPEHDDCVAAARRLQKEGRVRFVGDAATRIREDYLRILRLFRFQIPRQARLKDKQLFLWNLVEGRWRNDSAIRGTA